MERNITVLIANHNYGKWLEKAVESVENQDYPEKAICVIDDGSTDNSRSILEKLCPLGGNIPNGFEGLTKNNTYIHCLFITGPKGPSYARNLGIKHTWVDTDIWAVLDADDEMYPTKLSKFNKKFDDPNIGIVYGDYDTYGDDGVLIRNYKEPYSKLRLHQECIIHSGSAFSKEAVTRIGIKHGDPVFDESMRTAEDWDLWLRLSKSSMAYHIPESLTKVRIHNNNATNSVQQAVWQENWNKIRERMQNGSY